VPGWNHDSIAKRGYLGSAGEVLGHLSGRWVLKRSIEGHGSITGTATFSPEGKLFAYREEGAVRLDDGTELQGEREYTYRSRRDGFAVFFHEEPPRLSRVRCSLISRQAEARA
jgi:hypothetical protein